MLAPVEEGVQMEILEEAVPPQVLDVQPRLVFQKAIADNRDAGQDHPKGGENPVASPPSDVISTAAGPDRFAAELTQARKSEPAAPVELPWIPLRQIAHRVSIDVGEGERDVRVTLHERDGNVSIKFDVETETLRADLQSSVGTLIEALRREQVSLANLDFAGTPDRNADNQGQRASRQRTPQRQASTSDPAIQDTINIRKNN
jgi:hypothetical protein